MIRQRRQRLVHIEPLHAQAEVVNRGRDLAASFEEAERLRAGSDRERGRRGSLELRVGALRRQHRHPEESLIELNGALDVGHAERDVV